MNAAILLPEYPDFLAALKERILLSRIHTARLVNRELVLLYWDIGRGIAEKQIAADWGDAVVEQLASDLQWEFPEVRGFSSANLWRMKQFHAAHSSAEFLAQAVRELGDGRGQIPPGAAVEKRKLGIAARRTARQTLIGADGTGSEKLAQAVRELVACVPWGHHVLMLGRLPDPAARFYYLRATAQFGWSRSVLLNQIKAGAYERALREKKSHNFPLALPARLAEQADEMMKSRYSLDFLGVGRAVKERELEDRLVEKLRQFILELGYGFCFIGRQHRIALGRKEYFVDLLFYHRFLKALVAFDLKIGSFEPEHAGKMDFYLNLLNEKERAPDDQPSIGIILCAEKEDVEVEFALKTKNNPIGVAEYELQTKLPARLKGHLPTAEQLASVFRSNLPKTVKPAAGKAAAIKTPGSSNRRK